MMNSTFGRPVTVGDVIAPLPRETRGLPLACHGIRGVERVIVVTVEQSLADEPDPLPAQELRFDDFYTAEYPSVVRLAFALTGRLAVAEEMAQEAFLAAYRRWNRISRYDEPGAWVRRVVTHRCV